MNVIFLASCIGKYELCPLLWDKDFFSLFETPAVKKKKKLNLHCKIYDVKLPKTVIIQKALGVVDNMKHRNFT